MLTGLYDKVNNVALKARLGLRLTMNSQNSMHPFIPTTTSNQPI